MPCWELFAAQPTEYRERVLVPGGARVSVEAGVTLGWQRWLGERGIAIGVDTFGASAPAKILYEKYGLTVDKIVEAAQGLIG